MAAQVKQLGCSGVADLLILIEENKDASAVYVLFSGEADSSGESWCPDCVKAEPVVEEGVQKINDTKAVFILCSVGDRSTWKDPKNEFRTHDKIKLTAIPTLLKWNSKVPTGECYYFEPKRLVEDDCAKKDLVEMFFGED